MSEPASHDHDEDPHVGETEPGDWKYIAEGGASIVFSYVGPPRAAFSGTALRLRKEAIPPEMPHDDIQLPHEDDEDDEEPDDPSIVFQHRVVERLLAPAHLPRLETVRVERAWLERLAARTEELRPPRRRREDRINVHKRKAVLATDLVGGEGWAVEIKPKWGFLPAPTHLSDATRAVKTRTCRFCMHSHLKASRGADPAALGLSPAHAAPAFCPLDLFAGEPARVERALHALWNVWLASGARVNNLRVFVDGHAVTPDGSHEALAPLAGVLSPDPTSPDSTSAADLRTAFTAALLPVLLNSPVLRILATLQRTLDALDIEGLAALWARVRGPDAAPFAGGVEPDLDDWAAFLREYHARYPADPAEAGADKRADDEVPEATEAELRYRCLAYLLSATFKDCSVIVRLRPAPGEFGAEGGAFAATVTVIDMDVKGIDRLGKWAKLDREIVEAYADVAEPRVCVDQAASS